MHKAITKEELLELSNKQTTVKLVDIRSATEYLKNHIAESINIPAEELQNSTKLFAGTDTIICICNHGKERSQKAAETLYNLGFTHTFYLEGGTAGWFE